MLRVFAAFVVLAAALLAGAEPAWADGGQVAVDCQQSDHTAWERGGLAERSGAGDLDVVIYSARKWLRLALQGNPTVLLPLFVPAPEIVTITPAGLDLRANTARIVSKRCGARFLGYMRAQRDGMLGLRSRDVNRPELVARYGYDTKYAMHMLRLAVQGIELMSTGVITLPVPEPQLSMLRGVRTGGYDRQAVLDLTASLEVDLEQLLQTSTLSAEPDHEWANRWLHDAYTNHWQGQADALAPTGQHDLWSISSPSTGPEHPPNDVSSRQ